MICNKFVLTINILVILLISQKTTCSTTTIKCDINIDITDGIKSGTNITKNDITFTENDYFYNGTTIHGCICQVTNCLRRCCNGTETLNTTSTSCVVTSDATTPNLSEVIPSDTLGVFYIIWVPNRPTFCADPDMYSVKLESDLELKQSGVLNWSGMEFDYDNFCLENVDHSLIAVACVNEDVQPSGLLYALGMIISMPFLLATFLVYAALPDRNLHQKALMFYVISLFMAYILLTIVQLSNPEFDMVTCKAIGFSTVFFFMVSFFWMNVICIDIWFTFSGSRGFIGSQKASERRRLLIYCAYAWGMSFLEILIVILINEYGNPNASYYPGIGVSKCFLEDGLPTLLYFYGLIAIIIAINVILFSLTAYKIKKVKEETSMLKHNDSKRHTYEKDKQKFNLYLKLLFAMGVNWSMEIISWAVIWKVGNNIPNYVWYLTDFCNAIYGVFIFFIFVFKKKIWRLLQKRYYMFIGKPHLAHTLTTTQTTRSSHFSSSYSTAETGLNSDNRSSTTTNNGTNNIRLEERPLAANRR